MYHLCKGFWPSHYKPINRLNQHEIEIIRISSEFSFVSSLSLSNSFDLQQFDIFLFRAVFPMGNYSLLFLRPSITCICPIRRGLATLTTRDDNGRRGWFRTGWPHPDLGPFIVFNSQTCHILVDFCFYFLIFYICYFIILKLIYFKKK